MLKRKNKQLVNLRLHLFRQEYTNKKGSIFLTVFFIVLILGLFYLISLESQDNGNTFRTEQLQRSYLGSYGELIKEYSAHALREGGTRGSFISALNCADAPACYWLTYGEPSEGTVERAADSISSATRLQCNDFLQSIEGLNFGKIIINSSGKIDEVQVWVNDSLVKPINNVAPVDEYFNISAHGRQEAIIESGLSDEQRFVIHAYTMTIYPLRYWYLYRVIKKWIDDGVLTMTTCQSEELVQGQGGKPVCKAPIVADITVEQIVKYSVDKLEERFAKKDPFVTCNYTIPCSYAKTVILCCCNNGCPPLKCGQECTPGSDACNEYPDNCYTVYCPNICKILPPRIQHRTCKGGTAFIPDIECVSGDCDKSNMNFTGQYERLGLDLLDIVPLDKDEHKTPPGKPSGKSPVMPHSEKCDEPEPSCSKIKVKYYPPTPDPSRYGEEKCGEACYLKTGNYCHGFGENHTIEFVTEIVCTDKKYQQPVLPNDFKNLKFRIKAHVYLNHWVEPPPAPKCRKVKCC